LLTRTRAAVAGGLAAITMLAANTLPAAASASTLPSAYAGKLRQEVFSAWQITKGEGVTIAVLSNGVDPVTGLAGKVINGPDYAPTSGTPNAEGTVMASVIASSGPSSSDPLGIIGRAPAARILSLKIVDYGAGNGSGKYQQDGTWQNLEAEAIRYAVNHGAQVIVTDESGSDDQTSLDDAVAYANAKNAVVIGTGGSSGGQPLYPDSLPGVINFSTSVVSGFPGPPKKPLSPGNNSTLVTAPANPVFATCPGSQICLAYNNLAGVGWVASTVALIKAVYPHLPTALVARALALSATNQPAGRYNTAIGFGAINPSGALHEAAKLASLSSTAAPGAGVVSATARFGHGPTPAVINAVQHSTAKLAGYAGAIVIGLLVLLLALLLRRRWRRKAASETPFTTPPPPVSALG
jgi:hypothetical protein